VLSENREFWNGCGTEHHSGVPDRFITRCAGIGGCATFLAIFKLDRLNGIQRITNRGDNIQKTRNTLVLCDNFEAE
jgi:hypothetical protein